MQKEAFRNAILYNYDFIDQNDLSDSLTFNRYKTLFGDSFDFALSEGKPLLDKETTLVEWRSLFKENKATTKLTIDRVEVSENMAYSLYHYEVVLTNIKTGDLYFEKTQSAVAILRKNKKGEWKFEVLSYN